MPRNNKKDTENVLTDDISSENVSEVMKEILNRLTNIENKVDITNNLVISLEKKVNEAEKKLAKCESELASLSVNYDAILSRLNFLEVENKAKSKEFSDMKEENLAAKISINKIQQRGRLCTVRVLNMKDEVKNSREAALYLYDALFKTTLTDLKGTHPGYGRVIEYCHLLPSPPNKKRKFDGYNYIVRFHGRYYKGPIIENKKDIVTEYNNTHNLNIKIAHDFTWANREALTFLHDQKNDVSKVTFRGDRLLVKLTADGDSAPWREIINPFARDLKEMVASEE